MVNKTLDWKRSRLLWENTPWSDPPPVYLQRPHTSIYNGSMYRGADKNAVYPVPDTSIRRVRLRGFADHTRMLPDRGYNIK